jgi:hypothetical protein
VLDSAERVSAESGFPTSAPDEPAEPTADAPAADAGTGDDDVDEQTRQREHAS